MDNRFYHKKQELLNDLAIARKMFDENNPGYDKKVEEILLTHVYNYNQYFQFLDNFLTDKQKHNYIVLGSGLDVALKQAKNKFNSLIKNGKDIKISKNYSFDEDLPVFTQKA